MIERTASLSPRDGDASANKHRRVDLTGRERHLRGAMQAMTHVGQRFARAARRTLPFLVKRHARVAPDAVNILDLGADRVVSQGPIYEVLLAEPDGSAWGLLTLNSEALGLMLEGVLGAAEGATATSLGAALTLAQAALVGKLARALAQDFVQAVKTEVGITLKVELAHAVATGDEREAGHSDGLCIDCRFEGIQGGSILSIALGAEALEAAARDNDAPTPQTGDPRMAEAVCDVPIDIVAELGSVTLGLKRVLNLKVGQVLRLTTAVDDAVSIRVAGVKKFVGSPVISRGQLAVEIRGRHED
ncbi:MAG TPA: FliM/FliN family flagellar motor switch protein [Polyangiaceae bacterium]